MKNIKLRKSSTNKFISGVCGGIAEALGIDATIVRLIWAVLTIVTGIVWGVVLYILASIIMPEEDDL